MNVLIACEESQRVCAAFRARGHNAFSCDLQPCSGGHPEWHILGDALAALLGGQIVTMDGTAHNVPEWGLVIAHPPCTYLSSAGMHLCSIEKHGDKARQRLHLRTEAAVFFMEFAVFAEKTGTPTAIENPQGWMNTAYRKPDQIIHPYYFAESPEDAENWKQKRTCLWLFGLPPLRYKVPCSKPPAGFCESIPHKSDAYRAKIRSKTFPGIAKAMAEQWGGVDNGNL